VASEIPFRGAKVWHHLRIGMAFFTVLSVGYAALWVSLGIRGQASPTEVILWATPAPLLTWFIVIRPRLVVMDDEVIVVRPLTTRRFPLRQIISASPGYYGTDFKLVDGSMFTAATLQRPNYAVWFGRPSRADKVATQILNAAADLRGEPSPQPPGWRRSKGDVSAGLWAGIWAALGAIIAGGK